MPWYGYLLLSLFLLLLLIVFLGVPLYLCFYVAHPKRWERKDAYRREQDLFYDVDRMERTPFAFEAKDGYLLHGEFSIPKDCKGYFLFTHGYTFTREGMLKYAQELYALGYGCILYDLRGHGDNKRVPCTMGYREKEDLLTLYDKVREKVGEEASISLMGESLGASTSLLASAEREVDYLFLDCPFSSLKELLKYQLKQMHLPSFVLLIASPLNKLLYGYRFEEVEPLLAAEKREGPTLLADGKKDTFIPVSQSEKIYEAIRGRKELVFYQAEHAKSYQSDPKGYASMMSTFLKEETR